MQADAAAAAQHPAIFRNIALTLPIFCAGAPLSNGTRARVAALGVPADATMAGIRDRGESWPGETAATFLTASGDDQSTRGVSFEEDWGNILQKHRQCMFR